VLGKSGCREWRAALADEHERTSPALACNRRSARSSNPVSGCTLGVPCSALRTGRTARSKSTWSQRRSTSSDTLRPWGNTTRIIVGRGHGWGTLTPDPPPGWTGRPPCRLRRTVDQFDGLIANTNCLEGFCGQRRCTSRQKARRQRPRTEFFSTPYPARFFLLIGNRAVPSPRGDRGRRRGSSPFRWAP